MSQSSDDDPIAAVRPYVEMAAGILGISAAKAAELAQGWWTQGGDAVDNGVRTAMQTPGQVGALLSPDQVRGLVREEVERVVRRLGFAREDEVASLRREVGRLEQQVAALSDRIASGGKKSGKKSGGKKSGGERS
jgi:polyhydroxyalkanoate synthesis regulator phasin